jgi:hypothetical protein
MLSTGIANSRLPRMNRLVTLAPKRTCMRNHLSLLAVTLLCAGCATNHLLPYSETVMTPGMRVTATNRNGSVTMVAGEGTQRRYIGRDFDRTLSLIARTERWNGSLGLYDPADSSSPYGRLLAEEGRIHCSSVSEALRWLYVGSALNHPVYTNSGLVFCYSVARPPNAAGAPTRSVALWQLYIEGRRPRHLPGANDHAIQVAGGSVPDTSLPHSGPVGYALLQGDREYAGH